MIISLVNEEFQGKNRLWSN